MRGCVVVFWSLWWFFCLCAIHIELRQEHTRIWKCCEPRSARVVLGTRGLHGGGRNQPRMWFTLRSCFDWRGHAVSTCRVDSLRELMPSLELDYDLAVWYENMWDSSLLKKWHPDELEQFKKWWHDCVIMDLTFIVCGLAIVVISISAILVNNNCFLWKWISR